MPRDLHCRLVYLRDEGSVGSIARPTFENSSSRNTTGYAVWFHRWSPPTSRERSEYQRYYTKAMMMMCPIAVYALTGCRYRRIRLCSATVHAPCVNSCRWPDEITTCTRMICFVRVRVFHELCRARLSRRRRRGLEWETHETKEEKVECRIREEE